MKLFDFWRKMQLMLIENHNSELKLYNKQNPLAVYDKTISLVVTPLRFQENLGIETFT